MNILIPDSWLRTYLATDATPKQIQEALSLCGASVERLHKIGDDYVYDIEVTTNRPDMMSVIGIAKEATAILPNFGHQARLSSNPLRTPITIPLSSSVDYLNVKLDPKLCPRFSAVLIKGVKVTPSPVKIIKRLELAGMRGLNNIIDISNYLMIELGQPVHTFDYDKIQKSLMIVRESKRGERIVTLDGQTRTLPGGDVVIEDGSGKLIDLCGIMGGEESAIDQNTKNVLLFVQTYEPVHIRRTSMTLAHRTAAAVLFEKGTPIENVPPTLQYGIDLFEKLTGGKPVPRALDILSTKPLPATISLKASLTEFVNARLGINLSSQKITQILESLDFKVKSQTEIEIPPERRLDVTIPEDLVEEVARIYGYHNLPNVLMSGQLPTQRDDRAFFWEAKIRSALSLWGYTEMYTYSLVSRELENNPQALKIENPLTQEWEYLRTSLTTSHQKIIAENLGKAPQLDLFEIANVYQPQKLDLPKEELHLAVTTTNPDLYRLKGTIEALLGEMGLTCHLTPDMDIVIGKQAIGKITSHTNSLALTAELNFASLVASAKTTKTYTPISKFSPIIEDTNFTIPQGQIYADLIQKVKATSPLIRSVSPVDKYHQKLTLRITYHSDKKQLSSTDIEPIRLKLQKLSS